jgi:hypothetical protein
MLLSPLHDTIAHFLKKIPMDGTFNQELAVARMSKAVSDPSSEVFSYDLSAATDRLPIWIQKDIISYLLGNEHIATAWQGLMQRPFHPLEGKKMITYAVGQPMGAKSSFPMLALTHHFIVTQAALNARVKDFTNYAILGDDIFIGSRAVADAYSSIMRSLGVTINLSKSFIPRVNCKSAGEMCKRLFIDGTPGFELTALPPKLIVKCTRFGWMISALQETLSVRHWPISREHFLEFAAGLVDTQSLRGLIVLNAAPPATSGLKDPIDPGVEHLRISNWYKDVDLKDVDVENAHTFALISEQLKRLDLLLKATKNVAGLIATRTIDPKIGFDVTLCSGLSQADIKRLSAKLPIMSSSHPIVLASQYELQRVMTLLSALRGGTPEMVAAAKGGLLDLLRNSLTDIWMDQELKRASVTRSVFNSMLASISRICTKTTADNRRISFSLLLTSIQRMWIVDWTLGGSVYLNVVKSKVATSTTITLNRLTNTLSSIDMANVRL